MMMGMNAVKIFGAGVCALLVTGCQTNGSDEFAHLAGSCSGTQIGTAGTFNVSLNISPDGSFTWSRDGSVLTQGTFYTRGDQLRYRANAGSDGTASRNGRNLELRRSDRSYVAQLTC